MTARLDGGCSCQAVRSGRLRDRACTTGRVQYGGKFPARLSLCRLGADRFCPRLSLCVPAVRRGARRRAAMADGRDEDASPDVMALDTVIG